MRHELIFRVDVPGADDRYGMGRDAKAVDEFRARIYGALKLKVFSVAWVSVRRGTPRWDETLALLRKERVLVGSAHFAEILEEGDEPRSDWSRLETPQVSGSFSLWDDYPQFKPGSLKKNAHALNHTFVSEEFVAVCERAGLRGIEFLRCKNTGRKASPPWYAALPARALGHGLDHPWFDRPRWTRHVQGDTRKRFDGIDTGQSQFHQFWLRPQALDEPLVRELLEICPMPAKADSGLNGLKFVMPPRYLARVEPQDDFAYIPWGEDGANREGKMMRFRQLVMRRRARDALLKAGLFKPRDFLRLRSVAEPEAGVPDLDAKYPAIPPMYSTEELAAMRAQEKED
jgi:hypothetical protein